MACNCPTPTPCPPDPTSPEAITSQLENLIASLFGELTKTFADGRVVWSTPCDANFENPLFPRNAGEGLLCYLIRIYGNGFIITVVAPSSPIDFSMFPGGIAPISGFYQSWDDLNIYTIKGGDSVWFSTPR